MFITKGFFSYLTFFAFSIPIVCPSEGWTAVSSATETLWFSDIPVMAVSKKQETLRTTPGVVSILTRDNIDNLGVKSVAEALAFMPGVLAYDSFYDQVNQFAIRGNIGGDHTNAKILFLVDDHPVFEAITGAFEVNSIPIVDVERIEVVRGPVSVQYGTNAITGVIKIITRRAKTSDGKKMEMEGRYQGGGYNFHQGQLFAGGDAAGVQWSASAGGVYNHGNTVNIQNKYREAAGAVSNWQHQMWKRADTARASVGAKGFESSVRYWRDAHQPKIGITPAYLNRFEKWTQTLVSADAGYTLGLGDLGKVRALCRFDKFNAIAVAAPSGAPATNPYTDIRNNKMGGEVYADLTPVQSVDLTVGSAYDRYYHNKYFNSGGSARMRGVRISDTAGYANAQVKVARPLKLTAGTRYSENTVSGAHTDYQAGAIYDVNGNWTVKALHGTSYRAPNSQELYFDSTPTSGNDQLVPEVLKGVDMVLMYTDQKMTGQLTIYENRIVNMIKRVAISPSVVKYFNTPGEQSQGVEWELMRQLGARSAVWLEGSHILNPHELDEASTPGLTVKVVKNMAAAGARTDLLGDKLRLSAAVRYSDHWGKAESYWTTDAAVHYKVIKNGDVFIQGTNIFNKTYEQAEFSRQKIDLMVGGAPREVTAGVQVNF
jgi:outer membrane receptor for ferrienterochelin and colicins